MKLVIATPLYPPEPGGPATYARLLEEGLPSHDIETIVVKFRDVRHLPTLFRHMAYRAQIERVLKNADAVLALDPVSTGFPAYQAAKKLKKPFFLKIVGDYAWEQGVQRFGITDTLDAFVARKKVPLPVRMMRIVQTMVAKGATRIIVPSNYMKGIVEAWGIARTKIHVIYNAPRELHEANTFPRPQDAPSGPYLVSIARLVPWKGIDGALRAFSRLRDTHPSLSFVIVGDGPEEGRLQALSASLSLQDSVCFVGRKSQGEAPAYLAHAEALILNTGYEGFSHLILESFALGTPVITTPVGGNIEQVVHEDTGLLVPFQHDAALAAAIVRLLDDPALKRRIVENAKKSLSRFSRESLVTSLVALLRTTV